MKGNNTATNQMDEYRLEAKPEFVSSVVFSL